MSIWTATYPSGSTLYAFVRQTTDQQVVKVSDGSVEAYNAAHLTSYAIAATDNGGGCYTATIPATLPVGVPLAVYFFLQSGGSPNSADRFLGVLTGQCDGVSWQNDNWQANQIRDLQAALTATQVSPVVSVDASGNFTIVIGNDYQDADGNAINWTGTFAFSLVGARGFLKIYDSEGAVLLSQDLTMVSANQIQAELTSAQTSTLASGTYRYVLAITLATENQTNLEGLVTVHDPTGA